MVRYQEYAPLPELRPYVECFWSRQAVAGERMHRVLPDGCIDILIENERTTVVGTMTRAIVVEEGPSKAFYGVRFKPGGAYAFFGIPMREFTDRSVDMADVWQNFHATPDSIQQELLRRLPVIRPGDTCVQAAVSRIQSRFGQTRIDELCRELGVSRQHLTRKFDERIGISAKMFSRVVRLQALTRRIANVEDVDWCAVALDSGYYDQAHMIGEFKDIAGITPTVYHPGR